MENCNEQHESACRYEDKYFDDLRPNMKCVFRETGLKILGRVGKHFFIVGFVALRLKSTSMVIAGWSVHLTTLLPGQA